MKEDLICSCGNPKGYYAKTCMKCYDRTGKNNPNYGNGWKIAGKKCYWYGVKGKDNPNYTGVMDKKFSCKDCGKPVTYYSVYYGTGRCNSCAAVIRSKKYFPRFKIGSSLAGYYKGIWMRSSWELKFARWCDLSGYRWQYEPKRFKLGLKSYLPDFYLPDLKCYIELKGWFRKADQKKYQLLLKKYPDLNIVILFQKDLEQMGIICQH